MRVYAEDAAGNVSWKDAEIVIPGVDDPPLPTFTPTPTVEPTEEVVAPPVDATATPTPIPPVSEEDDEDEKTAPFVFGGNTPDDTPDTEPEAPAPSSSVLWGAAAAAAIGTYQATMAEKKRREEEAARARRNSESAARRRAEKKGRLDEYIRDKRKAKEAAARAKEERIRQKDEDRRAAKKREQSGLSEKEWKAKEAQQAIWDANGAAIYDANQDFKKNYGKEMDAATREQAIKDATVNGVFNATLYATNLQASAQQKKEDDPYAGIGEWIKQQDAMNAVVIEEYKEKERIARLMAAQESKLEQKIVEEIDPPEEEKSWWDIVTTGNKAASADANALFGRSRVFDNIDHRAIPVNWNSVDTAAEWAKKFGENNAISLEGIEGIGPATASKLKNAGYSTLADIAAASPEKLEDILGRKNKTIPNWISQAKIALVKGEEALEDATDFLDRGKGNLSDRVPGAQSLYQGPNVSGNWWKVANATDGIGTVADFGSLLGNGAKLLGAAWGETVAKVSDSLGIVGGAGQIGKNAKTAWNIIKSGKPAQALGAASKLAKFSGVLSAVTGVITIADGWKTAENSMQDGQWDATTTVGALDVASGVLSVIGGVTMFIPGAQPIAAVALGASAVLSGASTVVENWSTIQSFGTNISNSVSNTVQSWFGSG